MPAIDQVQPDTSRTTVPLYIDVAYATVSFASTTIWSILSGWMLYFYLPPNGDALVPPAFYGVVVFAARLINALLAAPIGAFSDRTRTRWGRRLPYMFVSALPMLALFVAIWTPPVQGSSVWNLVYLAVVFVLYNIAYSANQIAYTALLPELAATDSHRVRISAWSSSFFLFGMIAGGLVGMLIERVGYDKAALIYACAVLPLFYIPLPLLKRYVRCDRAPPPRVTLRESLAVLLQNRPFLIMTAAGTLYWIVTTFVQGVIPFIVTEVCELNEADTALFYAPALGISLLCYPLITYLSTRFGKRSVFAGSLIASAIILPTLMLIGKQWPISLRFQGIIWIALQSAALSGVTMLPPAFGAEITDYDAQRTGQRREGVFYATWGLIDQAVNAFAVAGLSWLLLLGKSQADPNGPLGVRLVGVIGGVLMLGAFFVFRHYPLGRPPLPERNES
jgi:GPH family glycoside/pentoside/hexuronide:cation symporter